MRHVFLFLFLLIGVKFCQSKRESCIESYVGNGRSYSETKEMCDEIAEEIRY